MLQQFHCQKSRICSLSSHECFCVFQISNSPQLDEFAFEIPLSFKNIATNSRRQEKNTIHILVPLHLVSSWMITITICFGMSSDQKAGFICGSDGVRTYCSHADGGRNWSLQTRLFLVGESMQISLATCTTWRFKWMGPPCKYVHDASSTSTLCTPPIHYGPCAGEPNSK